MFYMWASHGTRHPLPGCPHFVFPCVCPSHMWAAWGSVPSSPRETWTEPQAGPTSAACPFSREARFSFPWRSLRG